MLHLLTSCFCILLMNTAVHFALQHEYGFGWIRIRFATVLDRLLGMRASKIIQKPLWDCLPCMSSVWSTVWMLALPLVKPTGIGEGIMAVLMVCGASIFVDILIEAE